MLMDRDCDMDCDAGPDYCALPDGIGGLGRKRSFYFSQEGPLFPFAALGCGLLVREIANHGGDRLMYPITAIGEKIGTYWHLAQGLF